MTSVFVHPDAETLALATAAMVVEEARRAAKERGRFTVALAGGSTPKRAYELLAQPLFADLVPWEVVHVFWGDERCVGSTDPRSNERMARETLLDHVPIPPDQVYPMRCQGAAREARRAAAEYEDLLRPFLSLDLVLLGLGDNGHTASLFPGSEVLGEQERWVAAAFVDAADNAHTTAAGADLWRVTLTAPFINRAATVVFLAGGPGKAEIVTKIIEGPVDGARLPAQLIRPMSGRLLWQLDDESAALLGRRSP